MAWLVNSVEIGWKDVRWQKQRGPRDSQDALNRFLGGGIPA